MNVCKAQEHGEQVGALAGYLQEEEQHTDGIQDCRHSTTSNQKCCTKIIQVHYI